MRLLILTSVCLVVAVSVAGAEDYVDIVKKGNEALIKKDFAAAIEQYHIAEGRLPESAELNYNIATVLHEQGKYEEAIEKFTKSLNTTDPRVEAAAHYNLGSTHFRAGDYMKAIESYQKSLELNPGDMDAKYNLELARKMLKENSQTEQSDDQQQKQQQQEQEQQEQDKQQKDQQEDSPEQQEGQQQDKKDEQEQPKPAPDEEKKMSKEDAERILNALRDDEQKQQEKMRRALVGGNYVGNDW